MFVPIQTEMSICKEFALKCDACPLWETRKRVVWGRGNTRRNTKLFFVTGAPDAEEEQQGEPFIRDCAYVLEMWAAYLGLTDKDWYISNAVKCRPPDDRKPKKSEIKTCTKTWLFKEIKYVNPWVVIPVGRLATSVFLGSEYETGITDYRGQFYLTSKDYINEAWDGERRMIYPIIHPNYFTTQHQSEKTKEWAPQLYKLDRYLRKRMGVESKPAIREGFAE